MSIDTNQFIIKQNLFSAYFSKGGINWIWRIYDVLPPHHPKQFPQENKQVSIIATRH